MIAKSPRASSLLVLNLLAPVILGLAAFLFSPFFSGYVFGIAPSHTEGLAEVTQAMRRVERDGGLSAPEAISLPDDWKFTASKVHRALYVIDVPPSLLKAGQGLFIPAYRHHIKVWHQDHLIGESGTTHVGLPQSIMPPLRVMLPAASEEAPYRLEIEVLSAWSAEAGLGRVWLGEYTSLSRRQGFVVRNHEALYWIATGALLALTIYLGANSIMMRENYYALFLVVAHFVYIYVCVGEHSSLQPIVWFKIYFLFLALAVFAWIEHGFRLVGRNVGRFHLVFLPGALSVTVMFFQPDLNSTLWWRNISVVVLVVTGLVYFCKWYQLAQQEATPFNIKFFMVSLSVLMVSAAISDVVAIHNVGAIEHTASYRYLSVFVSAFMFIPMAIQVFNTELELKRRKSELDFLVELQTGELIVAQSKLQQSERLKTTYLLSAGLSHEIKNPLATLSATLQLMRRLLAETKNDMFLLAVDRMERNVQRIDQTVRDLNVHAKNQTVKLEHSNISVWLADCFDENDDVLALDAFDLDLDIQPVGKIHFDADKMYRVLSNLIQNAERACASVSHKKLSVSLRDQGDEVILSIGDNGSGLNESIANRVLEPLVSGSHSGLGFGLAFVRDIVEKHGGSFSLKNNIGAQGVTAFVRLPKK